MLRAVKGMGHRQRRTSVATRCDSMASLAQGSRRRTGLLRRRQFTSSKDSGEEAKVLDQMVDAATTMAMRLAV